MSFSPVTFNILSFFLPLLASTPLWAGLFFLSKGEQKTAWWVMFLGLVANAAGNLGFVFTAIYLKHSQMKIMAVTGPMIFFGNIVFGIGFCLHAMKVVGQAKRAAELETLCASMADVVKRLTTEEKQP